jgi:site-specific recombinase XerD
MQLIFFSGKGWQSWDVERTPVIPDRMPVLVDEDLRFEDGTASRATVAVNRWLRELPSSGAPSPRTWAAYARVVRDWMVFLAGHGIAVFDSRERLKAGLSAYAVHRAAGQTAARFAETTWNQHVSVLSCFYRWAVVEGHAGAVPFSYAQATVSYADRVKSVQVNLARRRVPKPHVTIKYLEKEFADLFVNGLRGLTPDGLEDRSFRGRDLVRNAAVGELALATGLRLQEFTYLLVWEIPALPARATRMPVPFPVPSGVTKGRKFRVTWISYEALAVVHRYIEVERAATAQTTTWLPPAGWGDPLVVTEPDGLGGRINGARTRWDGLVPAERRRLVGAGGGSGMLALRGTGGPFSAWSTVFERTADRIRRRWEPRFPHVHPHRLRHSFSIQTLERLVGGYYRQAAKLVADAGTDAALALYLTKADPLMVLRDLLGHASVTTTEAYLRRLDMTRIYQDAYERAGASNGLFADDVEREAAAEFDGQDDL